MDICRLATIDKRQLAIRVGGELEQRHGKKARYAVHDIKEAARRLSFPVAWDCWALSLYASPQDFFDYHARTGEQCDYASMHESMVEALAARVPSGMLDPSGFDAAHVEGAADAVSSSHDASWLDGITDWLGDAHHPDP